ncbi:Dos2-interacting transcription regulator of RNA-Pol-II-domain-containing protein [Ilyonectria robusta]|uniref:Dos2-interacting transcription regulator of RNA-Pol-II-domain-containing protein n=1 Tax=Ilyonectria robusta TaxID=1079257 RepID=UPI001E8CBA4D|nr:Dos2-interacting transcription regulator of RNA-Pol-II-domain-containing protein [Ilyonectria robusta]KAH8686920.1 Dos2-interacting transcription regulator of RNA-Pol-II-domain-containing protein [Ilyonectria robusta]
MADFRQLALEFVLADDEGQQTTIAKNAAKEIQTGAPNLNPVARWVEAVQPWMPGSGTEAEDGDETPDWTARAKALEFLSRTLDFLNKDALKPSQVKLLVSFFGAMFEVDHKAGILASANALSRIVAMKSFQKQSGNDIIKKVCALKDDFPRQVSKTRLAIYELVRFLMTTPEVSSDLQHKHGSSAGFMIDLLHLCRSERDPECLMVWFEILKVFLIEYSPSKEVLDEVYGAFKLYFPIALPRASQTGITPEDLKLQLRKCFSATHLLSDQTIPFLLGKLDQGDGVTVNVKVDILKTIRACLDEYSNPDQSVAPYASQIWGSLKYEVRNGEIEDTIWGTLEVLKSLTTRLKGDNLRDYTLSVTRDCVTDLANTTYTSSSGRLLVSVLSAKPSAFVLMVAPAITHIKDNLRHPKAPMHSQDLLRILHVILETRLLLADTEMSAEDREDFAAIDSFFKPLYEDVYKTTVESGSNSNVAYDDIKIVAQAVQGAGALVCQRPAKPLDPLAESGSAGYGRLLPERTCSQICESLFAVLLQSASGSPHAEGFDEIVDETTKALQRAIRSYPSGFKPLVDHAKGIIRSNWQNGSNEEAPVVITALCAHLAFVGCSELPQVASNGLDHFLYYIQSLLSELFVAFDAKVSPKVWCSLVATIQSTIRYFNDACLAGNPDKETPFEGESWLQRIKERYPELDQLGEAEAEHDGGNQLSALQTSSVAEIRNEFLLVSLFVARRIYRRATKTVESHSSTSKRALTLSDDFTGADRASENQYLHLISSLVGFVVHEMSEAQQVSLRADTFAISLFREDFISVPQTTEVGSSHEQSIAETGSVWSWLVLESLNVLSLAILEALRPSSIGHLFENGVAQELIVSGSSSSTTNDDAFTRPVTLSILTTLANKYKIEALPGLITTVEQHATSVVTASPENDDQSRRLEKTKSTYALAAGMMRRYMGKEAKGIVQLFREAPKDAQIGHHFGRQLEMIVAPQQPLTKENYAIVKPLWMQKVYFELVSPMLQVAVGADPEVQDQLTKTNFGIGVLLMVKHMNFPIYEADADKILRISLAVAQNIGVGPDAKAALDVLKNILVEAPEKGKDHIRSIIKICTNVFSNKSASTQKPDWLPEGYVPATTDAQTQAGCGKLALEITGGLPRMFESQHLLPHASQVERELTLACGHRVRDLRRTARLARAAWTELK